MTAYLLALLLTSTPHACTPTTAPEAAACTEPIPVHQPCAGVIVSALDLVRCEERRVELDACHRDRSIDGVEAVRAAQRADERLAACDTARRGHAEEAERCRAEVGGTGGPSWWAVVGVGAVGVAVGIVVGVLVSR